MKKYVAIFKTAWQNSLTWRGNVFFYFTLSFLPLIGYYFLWTSVFEDRARTAGFDYPALITYAVVAMIYGRLTWISPEYGVMENIREGTLTKYLIQPISYFGYYWSSRIGFRTFSVLVTIPFILVLIAMLHSSLLVPDSTIRWMLFIATMPIAAAIQFSFGMILGLLSFWILEARYFQFFKGALLALLGGALLPYAFFPHAIQTVFAYLPFKYLASFPLSIYLGSISTKQAIVGILVGVFWIFAFHIITTTMWRRGLKRFVAFGS